MQDDEVYYWDYLGLDSILTAQQPKSAESEDGAVHDEMLFIVIHQAYELWFKQILHELSSVCSIFDVPNVDDQVITLVDQRLGRIIEIQKLLIQQLNILKTMTPMDFLEFRDYLVPASGFQSVQFRMVEMRLGVQTHQDVAQTPFFGHLQARHQQQLLACEQATSLFSLIEIWLTRMPFLRSETFNFWSAYQQAVQTWLAQPASDSMADSLGHDIQQQQLKNEQTHFANLFNETHYQGLLEQGCRRLSYQSMQAALFIYLYRDQPIFHLPYQLLSKLVEIDDLIARWRYAHVLLVQRMIGSKMGTGGSSGHEYLKSTVEKHKIFTDFESLSTCLIPRSALPVLPQAFLQQLGFSHTHG